MTAYIVTELSHTELPEAAAFLHRYYDGVDAEGVSNTSMDLEASDCQTVSEAAAQGRIYALYHGADMVGIASYSREGKDTGRIKLMEIDATHRPDGVHAALQAISEGMQYEGRTTIKFSNERFEVDVQRALGVPEAKINHGGFAGFFKRREEFVRDASEVIAWNTTRGLRAHIAVRHLQLNAA